MSLTNKLIFAATMEQTNPPFTQTDYIAGRNLTAPNGLTPSILIPPFVSLSKSLGQYLTHANDDVFQLISSKTMMIRFRLNSFSSGPITIVSKFWRLETDIAGTRLFFSNSLFVFDGNTEIKTGTWYTVVWGIEPSNMFLRINKNDRVNLTMVLPFQGKFTNIITLGRNPLSLPSSQIDGDIGAFYIWNRSLSSDEMDSLADGADYPFAPPADDCKAVTCCEEPQVAYNASNPTPSGASNSADLCDPVPVVSIDPASGNTVTFPTYVFLSVSRPDAVIHYTTDGSTPTTASPVYTTPFQITSSIQVIQAFAVVAGCLPGPIAIGHYVESPTVFKFGYSCNTTDKVGQWGQFTPNGASDYHWTLQLKLPNATVLKRMELYQTNAAGFWNSGQAWSTDEFINPKEGPPNFHVFPMGVFDDGLNPNVTFAFTNQLNTTYLATFKTLANQTYLWTLIGQPVAPLNGFFKLLLFLGDGTVMESIIGITCGDPPPPCPGPAAPTLTPTCSGIDIVTTANTDGSSIIGKNFTLLRAIKAPCGDGVFRSLTTGVIASNPQTFHDTGLTDGCTYCYALQVDEGGDCNLKTSPSVCAQPKCLPQGVLALTIPDGCYPKTITVAWSTTCVDDGVTQTRIVQELSGCHAEVVTNVTGNDDGSMNVTVSCDTQFTLHYGNACLADQTKSDAVIVTPASCNQGSLPAQLTVQGWNDSNFFDLTPCSVGDTGPCAFGASIPSWNGRIALAVQACTYAGGTETGLFFQPGTPGEGLKAKFNGVNLVFDNVTNKWILGFSVIQCLGGSQSGGMDLWTGSLNCNGGPAGLYTRISGCSTLGSIMLG